MKKLLIVLSVVAVGSGAWFWLKHRAAPAAADADPAPSPAAEIAVAPLRREEIARTLDAFGVVEAAPSSDVSMSAPFDCLVKAVAVGRGARVAVGDLLLQIEPSPDAGLALQSAQTALAAAVKTLEATQERYDLKLATTQELLTAKQAVDEVRLKIASFMARGLGGDGRITAPSAGVVSKLEVAAGALVPAGSLLVSVVSADRLEGRLGVEIDRLADVHAGQAVTLVSANRPTLPNVAGAVRATSGAVDPTTGAAEIRVALPPDTRYYLSEHVRGVIVVEQREALVAPRNSVLPEDGKFVLFTVHDGKAVKHEVEVGIEAGDRVEVRGADLHVGDSVVTLGNYELVDGMEVQTAPPAVHRSAEVKP